MPPARSGLQAAGAVLWRGSRSAPEIALVHRARYDDWSLPKGKINAGETDLDAAVREVTEETGALVTVSRRLGRTRYSVASASGAQRKTVEYWAMRYTGGEFAPNDEVDQLDWLPAREARARLQYGSDRIVLDEFDALPLPESVIVLVRHARAGKRSEWRGRDDERPLDPAGREQARRLIGFFAHFAPDRVISADRVRCIETVTPFANSAGLDVQIDPTFADESYLASATNSVTATLALAKPGRVSVVCSQGLTIPSLIDRLGPGIVDSTTRKASAWALSLVDGDVVAADRYDDAAGLRG